MLEMIDISILSILLGLFLCIVGGLSIKHSKDSGSEEYLAVLLLLGIPLLIGGFISLLICLVIQ